MHGFESMTDADGDPTNGTATAPTCDCCGSIQEPSSATESGDQRWLSDSNPLESRLPADVGAALGQLLGTESVATLAEWISEMRRRTGGGSISTADLCISDEETPHRAIVNGDTYYFLCFYDGVVLAALTDEPVEIRTESPAGTDIQARAIGTSTLTVSPETAVFAFGADPAARSDGDTSHETIYAAVCPYVRAFPNRQAYDRWAETVPAATVAMPLADATDIAAAIVE
jgi:hypothetical protein